MSSEPGDPLLFLALECEDLTAGPARWSLAATDGVLLGRAEERSARREGRTLELCIADRRMSSRHARMIRVGEHWIVEDRGSKNGTIVNGRPVRQAELKDGDLLELGRTMLLFRHAGRSQSPIRDRDLRAMRRVQPALRTLSAPLGRSYERLAELARAKKSIWIRGDPGTETESIGRVAHGLSGKRSRRTIVRAGRDPLPKSAQALLVIEVGELSDPDRSRLLEMLRRKKPHVVCTSENAAVHPEIPAAIGEPISVLALRERREDLGLWLASCLHAADEQYAWAIEPAAARALFAHDWPGNVRELRELTVELAKQADQGLVQLSDLPENIRPLASDRERVTALLKQHAGNVTAVARALGRDRSAVRRWLGRLAIDPRVYR